MPIGVTAPLPFITARPGTRPIGTCQFVFPGVAGNYLSVPDAADLDITGDIEMVHRWSCTDLARQNVTLTSKGNPYLLYLDGFKRLRLDVRIAAANSTAYSGFNNTWVNNTLYWTKVTRVAATGAVAFYTAADQPTEPTSWTAAGTGSTTAGPIDTTSVAVEVGASFGGASFAFPGRIARAIVRNGIAGTTVLDVAESNAPAPGVTSFIATTGQSVTVNQTAGNTIVQALP